MASIKDVRRVIARAPYRHTWVFRNNNGNLSSNPSSATLAYFAHDACGGISAPGAPITIAAQGSTGGFMHYLDLNAAAMSADLIELIVTASGVNAHYARLIPEANLHSGVAAAGSLSDITLPSSASAVSGAYNGATIELVRKTTDPPGNIPGQIRTIVNYSSFVATVDRAWTTAPDSATVYIIHPRAGTPTSQVGATLATLSDVLLINNDATAAQMLAALYKGAFVSATVTSASPTVTSFTGSSGLQTLADFYGGSGSGKNMLLVFTSGTLKGLAREVIDYTASRVFTTEAFPVAPANGDSFLLISVVQ